MTDIRTVFIETAGAIMPGHIFKMYFEPLEFLRDEQGTILNACQNDFTKLRLEKYTREYGLLVALQAKLGAEIKEIKFIVDGKKRPPRQERRQTELPLETTRPAPALKNALDPNLRKDNLVIHSGNNEANELLETAGGCGGSLVYLYGPPGSGLSHLAHAFGHILGERNGADKVRLISAAEFQDLVVSAFRPGMSGSRPDPRSLFSSLRALIIEDLQFLTGPRSGKELALIIKAVLARQGSVFLTADAPHKDLPAKSPELRQVLTDAYLAKVSPASDQQARTAIVASIVGQNGFQDSFVVDADVLEFLVERLPENTRAIRGILNNLLVRSKFRRQKIDRELIRELLMQHGFGHAVMGSENLFQTIAKEFGVTGKEIMSPSRRPKLVEARKFFAQIAHAELGLSVKEIGKNLGRNRSTVIFYLNEMAKDLAEKEAARIKQERILRTFHSK